MRRLVTITCAALLTVHSGCISEMTEEDGLDDSFVDAGKSDGQGGDLEPFEVLGVLRLVNEGDLDYLDQSRADGGVGLASNAVAAIADLRAAAEAGPSDPDGMLVESLAQLDAIDFIGPKAFARLLVAAREDHWIRDAPPACRTIAAPTGQIPQFIELFTSDGDLSVGDWSFIENAARVLPKRASSDARAIVAMLASPTVAIEADVRARINLLVERQWGYAPPSATTTVAESLASNVTEVDRQLACLSSLAGHDATREVVGVIDSGFQLDHPALSGRIFTNPTEVPDNGVDDDGNGLVDDVSGWDFLRNTSDVLGPDLTSGDHGTHTGGCAVTGSSRLQMLALRAMDGLVQTETGPRVVAAIDYAAAHSAVVVNMSQIVTPDFSGPVIEAMARHPDMLFVVAAGNTGRVLGSTLTNAPLVDVPNVMIVAAHDSAERLTSYSTFGAPGVDLAALGDRVSSRELAATEFYALRSGSSQAAPAVANAAAKMRLVNPSLHAAELRTLLTRTVDIDARWSGIVAAGGTLNVSRAVALAALLDLVGRGIDKHEAAYRLLLSADDRRTLLPLLDTPR